MLMLLLLLFLLLLLILILELATLVIRRLPLLCCHRAFRLFVTQTRLFLLEEAPLPPISRCPQITLQSQPTRSSHYILQLPSYSLHTLGQSQLNYEHLLKSPPYLLNLLKLSLTRIITTLPQCI